MTYVQNIIYYLKSKTYLCTDRICARYSEDPILNQKISNPTNAPCCASDRKKDRTMLYKPHTRPASTDSSHRALSWSVSLGGASSSRTGMANSILFLNPSRTKNPRRDLHLPISWIPLIQSYWTSREARTRNKIQAIQKINHLPCLLLDPLNQVTSFQDTLGWSTS